MKKIIILILFLLASVNTKAHLGNNAVFYEGNAGPYQVRVYVQPPEVVPGLAEINVRVHNGPVSRVSALPARWDAGRKGAPAPDIAKLVAGETNLYNTQLWLMSFGSYSVFVDVDGPLGHGTAIVPVNSISNRRLAMPEWMGAAFLITGCGLVFLLICIVGAAVRESTLPLGVVPDRKRQIWSGVVMICAGLIIGAVLWRGKVWWDKVDTDFRNNRLYQPLKINSKLEANGKLVLEVNDRMKDGRDRTPLVADHGKLMHLFLIREADMNAFAHLHPLIRPDGEHFESMLQGLPAGKYSVYGDVVHESGLAETYISEVTLDGAASADASADIDDSYWSSDRPSDIQIKPLSNLTVKTRQICELKFEALAKDGAPAPLEPYMGMWSHAVIRSKDGAVFTHLHPQGTISMASQELFARRERGESPTAKPIEVICGRPERELLFPYSFPKPGEYRMWVQVKSAGEVRTQAVDIHVE